MHLFLDLLIAMGVSGGGGGGLTITFTAGDFGNCWTNERFAVGGWMMKGGGGGGVVGRWGATCY